MDELPSQHESVSGSCEATSHEFQSSLVRAICGASPDGILVVDDKANVTSLNQRFLEVWGIPNYRVRGGQAAAVVGTPDQPILAMALERVKDSEPFLRRVRELYEDPNQDDHCEIELKDGRTLERHSTVLWSEQGRYLGRVWFFRDITARKQTEIVLREMALTDPLTGVANRRHFFARAKEEFGRARRYARPLSFLMLDMDHFKRINDRYGHARGDLVLKAFCDGCRALLRDVDLFARTGGEEFAVLLPETTLDGARVIAERLRQFTAGQKVETEGGEITWTISAGVAMSEPSDADLDACLQRADNALYRAKERGRNRVETDVPPGAG
jgi:diguanylate cyclase (GGDEF)-like protein/PAS domain S-box-containing protein